LDPNDLALVDSQGELVPIANLTREWVIDGPGAHSNAAR
jgi:hypothetical protein